MPPDPTATRELATADGERLHAEVWPGPSGSPLWVVLAHGFSGSTAVPALRRVAAGLARHAHVLAYDARGHGRSTGRTTLGDREVLDVDAAVARARGLGAGAVATVGFSMGAAAVVRHAAGVDVRPALREAPDAVVAVSGTAAWSTWATASTAMRRLHVVVRTPPGRALARRLMGTHVDPGAHRHGPVSPLDCVAAVRAPLLLVHGDRDGYLGTAHARALGERSGAPLWLEPGLGHAEVAMTAELVDRIGTHVAARLAGRLSP